MDSSGMSKTGCDVGRLFNQSRQYQTVRRQYQYRRLNAADTFMEFIIPELIE